MKQVSLILPTTTAACEMAARACAIWLQEHLLGLSILDIPSTRPPEGPDEAIGVGVVRGYWRENADATVDRDRSALVLIDLALQDEAGVQETVQSFLPMFFRVYRSVGEPQTALYLGVQAARQVSYVKGTACEVWTLSVSQRISGVTF